MSNWVIYPKQSQFKANLRRREVSEKGIRILAFLSQIWHHKERKRSNIADLMSNGPGNKDLDIPFRELGMDEGKNCLMWKAGSGLFSSPLGLFTMLLMGK